MADENGGAKEEDGINMAGRVLASLPQCECTECDFEDILLTQLVLATTNCSRAREIAATVFASLLPSIVQKVQVLG